METVDDRTPGPGPEPAAPAPRRSFFREVPWRWYDVLIGLAPIAALVSGVQLLVPAWRFITPSRISVPVLALAEAWVFAYPLWVARRRHAGSPHLPGARAAAVEVLIALLAVPVVMLAISAVAPALSRLSGESATPAQPRDPIAWTSDRAVLLAFVFLGVVVAPVGEEVFFRGMLYNALRRRFHPIIAVPAQALIFALAHPFGVADRLVVALIGLALATIYEWRKRLVTPMLLHSMLNAVIFGSMLPGIAAQANAPRLGVIGERHEGGCRLTEVLPGSAADAAGLRAGDVVTALDGVPVSDIQDMFNIIYANPRDKPIAVDFIRDGAARRVEATPRARGN